MHEHENLADARHDPREGPRLEKSRLTGSAGRFTKLCNRFFIWDSVQAADWPHNRNRRSAGPSKLEMRGAFGGILSNVGLNTPGD